tara:strand:- start:194 stop:616 length:423 start_codon:yes stop_codon:yes gene_type:complete
MRYLNYYVGSIIILTAILTVLIIGSASSSDNISSHERMNDNTTKFVQKTLVCEEMEYAMNFMTQLLGQQPLFRWTDINSGTTYMIMFNMNDGSFTVLSNPTNVDTNIVCWETQGNNLFVYTEHFKIFVNKWQKFLFGTGT